MLHLRANGLRTGRCAAPKVSTFHSLGLSLTDLFEKHELLPRRRLEASEAVEKKLAREAVLAALKEEGSDEYPSLLSDPVTVMRANPRALALVTNKLDLVVVDEFQDVSRVQVELLIQIHQVKGREFPLVIVTGLEDGLFPSRRADAEEERRLASVALTRVQEQLLLVVPPDARFDAAWLGTPIRDPARAKSPASPFAFEANLRTSTALGEAITRRLSGDGLVVGLRDRDILDINFGGIRRSIKSGVVAMERV